MIHVTINGKPVEVSEGSTIMEAAETVGIRIPSLCHMKNVHQYGSCRICVVEVEGMKNLQASCMAKVREGMVIRTHSPKVLAARKVLYELLLSNHPKDCLNCSRNTNCELQELGYPRPSQGIPANAFSAGDVSLCVPRFRRWERSRPRTADLIRW